MVYNVISKLQQQRIKSILCAVVCQSSGSSGTGDVVGPSSAVNNDIAVFSGTTGKLIADGGITIAALQALIPSLSGIITSIPFNAFPNSNQAITNQPAAETYLISSNRNAIKFDATKYNFCRVMCNVQVSSASANSPRLYVKYKTSFAIGDLVSTFTTIGSGSGTDTCSLAATGLITSDWVALPAGAKADVFFCIVETGGDGVADPAFGMLNLEFKI